MRRWRWSLVLLTLGGASAAGGEGLRELAQSFEAAAGQTVRIQIPVAELKVEAVDGQQVSAELTVRCRWALKDCQDALGRLELASLSSPKRLLVELAGVSKWSGSKLDVEGRIRVPRGSPLEVEMDVAELEVSGVEQDLRVDVGVGEVRAWLKADKFGRTFLDVGIGQAELIGAASPPQSRRSLLVGSEVNWSEGSGEARIDIEVGVGEVTVWFE